MTCFFRNVLASLAPLRVAAHAHAYQAGWMQIQVAATTPDGPTTTVAMFYPTTDRIASDSRGPRVGALGHSVGGYTVLALAGARPDVSQLRKHCQTEAAEDPIFCDVGRSVRATSPLPAAVTPSLKDERVRAIVAMAPTGVLLSADARWPRQRTGPPPPRRWNATWGCPAG